jgi:hypothetical protein
MIMSMHRAEIPARTSTCRRARDAEVPGDGHVAGALDDIPKPVVVAVLGAGRDQPVHACGACLLLMGKPDPAGECFKEALTFYPDDAASPLGLMLAGCARRGRDGAGGIDAAEGQQHRPRARQRTAVQNRVESEVGCSRRTDASKDACAALCSSATLRRRAMPRGRSPIEPSLLNPFALRHLRQHSRNWPIAPLTSDNSLSVSQRF